MERPLGVFDQRSGHVNCPGGHFSWRWSHLIGPTPAQGVGGAAAAVPPTPPRAYYKVSASQMLVDNNTHTYINKYASKHT